MYKRQLRNGTSQPLEPGGVGLCSARPFQRHLARLSTTFLEKVVSVSIALRESQLVPRFTRGGLPEQRADLGGLGDLRHPAEEAEFQASGSPDRPIRERGAILGSITADVSVRISAREGRSDARPGSLERSRPSRPNDAGPEALRPRDRPLENPEVRTSASRSSGTGRRSFSSPAALDSARRDLSNDTSLDSLRPSWKKLFSPALP